MLPDDLPAAARIEAASFDGEWPATAFANELRNNAVARYVLLERRNPAGGWDALGFAGLWLQFDQAHVVTVAVLPAERRNGYGRLLVYALLRLAMDNGMADATLELRKSNGAARALYAGFGFHEVGERRRYYPDGEDALIMTTEAFESERFRPRFAGIGAAIASAFGAVGALDLEAMGF